MRIISGHDPYLLAQMKTKSTLEALLQRICRLQLCVMCFWLNTLLLATYFRNSVNYDYKICKKNSNHYAWVVQLHGTWFLEVAQHKHSYLLTVFSPNALVLLILCNGWWCHVSSHNDRCDKFIKLKKKQLIFAWYANIFTTFLLRFLRWC